MVEDVGLNGFIGPPALVVTENVDLDSEARRVLPIHIYKETSGVAGMTDTGARRPSTGL